MKPKFLIIGAALLFLGLFFGIGYSITGSFIGPKSTNFASGSILSLIGIPFIILGVIEPSRPGRKAGKQYRSLGEYEIMIPPASSSYSSRLKEYLEEHGVRAEYSRGGLKIEVEDKKDLESLYKNFPFRIRRIGGYGREGLSTEAYFHMEKYLGDIGHLEEKMRPGSLSTGGFIGEAESLAEVMYKDEKALEKMGVTYEDVAERIEEIIHKVPYLSREPTPVEIRGKKFHVRGVAWRGGQECPFGDGTPEYSNLDLYVENEEGHAITFPGMIAHLIRKHRFFEGEGSPYRLDPERAVKILGIEK